MQPENQEQQSALEQFEADLPDEDPRADLLTKAGLL